VGVLHNGSNRRFGVASSIPLSQREDAPGSRLDCIGPTILGTALAPLAFALISSSLVAPGSATCRTLCYLPRALSSRRSDTEPGARTGGHRERAGWTRAARLGSPAHWPAATISIRPITSLRHNGHANITS